MRPTATIRRVARVILRPVTTEPSLVRRSMAVEARRLRREADAFERLLLRRLAERGEPPADFDLPGEVPDEDEVLIDTALYHAALARHSRARKLVGRDRFAMVAAVALAASLAALVRSRAG